MRLPSVLRPLAAGQTTLTLAVEGEVTVAAVLDALAGQIPELGRRVRDEQGRQRPHVNLFLGDENVRDLGGLGVQVPDGAELWILPAVSGG